MWLLDRILYEFTAESTFVLSPPFAYAYHFQTIIPISYHIPHHTSYIHSLPFLLYIYHMIACCGAVTHSSVRHLYNRGFFFFFLIPHKLWYLYDPKKIIMQPFILTVTWLTGCHVCTTNKTLLTKFSPIAFISLITKLSYLFCH